MATKKDTFCLAPWYSIHLNSRGYLSPCCKFQDQKKKYKYNEIENYFTSPELEKVRQDLLQGVRNYHCTKCWDDEDKGGDSLRQITNRTIALHNKINLKEQLNYPKTSSVRSFDLTLGNLCNLKCIMCSPQYSSQLLAEANTNPALKSLYDQEYNQKEFDWPNGDDFVDWCNQYLQYTTHIKFTGGEPFIIPWIKEVIERMPDSQKEKCVLHFTSNLTVIDQKLFKCFEKFKEVWLSVSVEGTHDTHEYLRHGHTWQKLTDNLKIVQDMAMHNLRLKINHVVQAPSFHSIMDMTNFFDSVGLEIHPVMLYRPKHFHISALTRRSKEKFLADTEYYVGLNKEFIKFVRNATQENVEQDKELNSDCIKHLDKLDRTRKNNHKNIIPIDNLY